MTLWKWSRTAATNATADSTINWAEGQAPSSVNDSARAMMAAAAKFRDDICGAQISSTGSSNAYVVTSNQGFTSLQQGQMVAFIANMTNTGLSTLNVDGLGAIPIRAQGSVDLPAASIIINGIYLVTYQNGNQWLLINPPSLAPIGSYIWHSAASAPLGYLAADGSAVSRTTYAALFAITSTTYGAGDASTTFNIPDLRGRVLAGYDASATTGRLTSGGSGVNSGAMGATGGVETTTLITSNLPAYTPAGSVANGTLSTGLSGSASTNTAASPGAITVGVSVSSLNGATVASGAFTGTAQGGTSTAFNNVPPTIVAYPCIKY